MAVTIATHNGHILSRGHNLRLESEVSNKSHIDRNGEHETWFDAPAHNVYRRVFGEALARYNARQKRAERKIKDYYDHVKKDKQKHARYEMIVGVYNGFDCKQIECDKTLGKAILQVYAKTWKDRNPNLELLGVYYHADEEGEPHLHIDYVPVAHGYKKGLDTQACLNKALEEQEQFFQISGKRSSMKDNAVVRWTKRENEFLEMLCNEAGLKVDHPRTGKKHMEIEKFKEIKQLERELEKQRTISRNIKSYDVEYEYTY